MKKAHPARRRPASTRKVGPESVDDYIDGTPEPARTMLKRMRTAIRSAVPPDAVETISYRIPAFKRKRVLVWYAAFANHCSLFPTGSVIEAFKRELRGFATSKGTIQLPLDEPLPILLIRKLVRARVQQAGSGTV